MAKHSSAGEKRIGLVGAGNVAWHLAHVFRRYGHSLSGICSRTHINGRTLAEALSVPYAPDVLSLGRESDVVFICVPDDQIAAVATQLRSVDALICHCSGTTPLQALNPCDRRAVFYPMQTFTRGVKLLSERLPLFVEAVNDKDEAWLLDLGRSLEWDVYRADSEERKWLHVSAVMSCNFANALWGMAADLLRAKTHIPFSVMHPLMRETLEKAARSEQPFTVQTGPAVRNDRRVIQEHQERLVKFDPAYAEVYRLITEIILNKVK